jgi:hypothetical protein
MPPESDPHFKAAFAELHRRQCAQAPSFEAMRSRAQRAARAGQHPRVALRVRWATTGACLALLALCGGAWLAWRPPATNRTASAQRVEQLLAAIEQQLDRNAERTEPEFEFPTDILLTQNQPNPEP